MYMYIIRFINLKDADISYIQLFIKESRTSKDINIEVSIY